MSDPMMSPETYALGTLRTYCPVQLTVEALSGRWKALIMWHLVNHESMRYSELKRSLRTVTHKMLAQSLRELEADGLIERTIHQVVPPRVDYFLSEQGELLRPVFAEMARFGRLFSETNTARPAQAAE